MRRLLLVALLSALIHPQAAAAADTSPASATSAYQEVFGAPPTVASTPCFAMLGYLPLSSDPARVRPFPLFALHRDHLLRQLVEKLLTFDRGIAARAGLALPFPAGTRLTGFSRHGEQVRIELQLPNGQQGDPRGMLLSLAHSAGQFPGTSRLVLVLDGKPAAGQGPDGYRPAASEVADPGPPLLLAARLGSSESSPPQPELALLFDRPIRVDRLELRDAGGREVPGERFLSVFDMAVVIHPPPAAVKVGDRLQVDVQVTDLRGRAGRQNRNLAVEPAAKP